METIKKPKTLVCYIWYNKHNQFIIYQWERVWNYKFRDTHKIMLEKMGNRVKLKTET